jgi:hypothetical protein
MEHSRHILVDVEGRMYVLAEHVMMDESKTIQKWYSVGMSTGCHGRLFGAGFGNDTPHSEPVIE